MVNRQMETIYLLINKGIVTAEELAEHFEVSTRTVYRDIESLSMAGIPVYANRGKGGGIRLMDRFVLDKRLLSREEQGRILAALASLRETGAAQDGRILEKLETFFGTEPMDWVSIDFSDWSGRRGNCSGRLRRQSWAGMLWRSTITASAGTWPDGRWNRCSCFLRNIPGM